MVLKEVKATKLKLEDQIKSCTAEYERHCEIMDGHTITAHVSIHVANELSAKAGDAEEEFTSAVLTYPALANSSMGELLAKLDKESIDAMEMAHEDHSAAMEVIGQNQELIDSIDELKVVLRETERFIEMEKRKLREIEASLHRVQHSFMNEQRKLTMGAA